MQDCSWEQSLVYFAPQIQLWALPTWVGPSQGFKPKITIFHSNGNGQYQIKRGMTLKANTQHNTRMSLAGLISTDHRKPVCSLCIRPVPPECRVTRNHLTRRCKCTLDTFGVIWVWPLKPHPELVRHMSALKCCSFNTLLWWKREKVNLYFLV